MTNGNRKNIIRSTLTGRIANGKEVILLDEIEEYMKKQGYKFISPNLIVSVKVLTIIFLVMGFMILNINLVSSQPFQTSINFNEGFTIVPSPQYYIKQNQDYQLNFFVYNQSNGLLINNDSVTCELTIADLTGEIVFNNSVDYLFNSYWGVDINGSTFLKTDSYAYGIRCQSDSYGSAYSGIWEVTPTGVFGLKTNEGINIVIIVLLIVGGISFALLFNNWLFASISLMIAGFILLLNDINIIISFLLIGIGVWFAFKGGRE